MALYTCSACGELSVVEVGPDPHTAKMAVHLQEHVALLHATCPRCGARNPETVASDRRDERNITIITFVALVAAGVGGYFVPWIVIGYLSLMTVVIVIATIAQRGRYGVTGALLSVGWVALACVFPGYAFLLPVAAAIQTYRRGADDSDRRWQEAAARLRFADPVLVVAKLDPPSE